MVNNFECMASSSEDVHSMVNKVKHKKKDGVLYLMSERIAWCPHGKDHFDVSHLYADIKCQKISPEGKPKIQLQIVLLNGEAKTFHFANANTDEAKEQRNGVKDILSEMISKFRRKMDKDLEEKNRLLQEDKELFQTYKDLVVSGVITPEEFWATHSKKLFSGTTGKQSVGVSASFLANVKPQSDGCNGLRYNLTADTIESIFRTYPAAIVNNCIPVKKKYMDKVPEKLSEKEFWTMFFQSHYFHRDRVNQSNSKDIFSDCAKKDDQDVLTLLQIGVKNPLVDLNYLTDEDSTKDEGYGTASSTHSGAKVKQSSTQLMNKNIIKRFNHQSAMILSSCIGNQTQANGESHNSVMGNGDAPPPPVKKMRLRESMVYDDLEETDTNKVSTLNLQKSERYSHGPTLLSEVHEESNSRNLIEGLNVVNSQCSSYRPRLHQVLSSSNASAALAQLSPDSSTRASMNSEVIDQLIPKPLRIDLRNLYASATELLRHFWSCFPANTPVLQKKIARMYTSMENFRQTRLAAFQQELMQNRVEVDVTRHISDMFDQASAKFNAWQSKKQNKR